MGCGGGPQLPDGGGKRPSVCCDSGPGHRLSSRHVCWRRCPGRWTGPALAQRRVRHTVRRANVFASETETSVRFTSQNKHPKIGLRNPIAFVLKILRLIRGTKGTLGTDRGLSGLKMDGGAAPTLPRPHDSEFVPAPGPRMRRDPRAICSLHTGQERGRHRELICGDTRPAGAPDGDPGLGDSGRRGLLCHSLSPDLDNGRSHCRGPEVSRTPAATPTGACSLALSGLLEVLVQG